MILTFSFDIMRISLNHPNAKKPTRGTNGSAGYDLYATDDQMIVPGKVNMIPIHISAAIPEGYYGRIAPRSGLAAKYGADVLAGVIDSDYRGNIVVLMVTLKEFQINCGYRVAQLILERILCPELEVVPYKSIAPESSNERGTGGFGSTGDN